MKLALWMITAGAFVSATPVLRLGGLWFSDILVLTGSTLAVLLSTRDQQKFPLLLVLACIFVAPSTVLASIFAVDTWSSLVVGMRILFVWLVFGIGIWVGIRASPKFPAHVLQAFVWGAAVSALGGIAQATTGFDIMGSSIQHNRMPGLTGHPNAQGGVLGLAIPICAGFVVAKKRLGMNTILLVTVSVGLVLSGSVSGMIGALTGVAAAIILGTRPVRGLAIMLGLISTTWAAGAYLSVLVPGAKNPWERFMDTTGQGEGESTMAIRQSTFEEAWAGIKERPISGFGLDPASGATVGELLTHNMLLLVWYQGGIMLLIAYIILLAASTYRLAQMLRWKRRDAPVICLIGGCISAFVTAMTGPQMYDRWFWLPFLIALSLATVPHLTPETKRKYLIGKSSIKVPKDNFLQSPEQSQSVVPAREVYP